jgi:hypothetical protein
VDDLASGMAKQLVEIVHRYRQHKEELRPQRTGKVDMSAGVVDVSVGVLTALYNKPRWALALDEVKRDPVRFALRDSAREIGWQAYADGGLELMQQICGLTEEAGATVNKWWDRIGGKGGGAWSA